MEARRVRLQKIMAERGIASRRAAEQMLLAGRVSVNGTRITKLGTTVDPNQDVITVDNRELPADSPRRVILLNKPVGYLSSCKPSREEGSSLLALLPNDRRYFPVGRLDRDTSGMIIVTDDGELALQLSHPRYGTQKTYIVTTTSPLAHDQLEHLAGGVLLDDGPAKPLRIDVISRRRIALILGEGRNRLVRRMLSAIGSRVSKLERIAIGTLALGNLKPGQWRYLSAEDIAALKSPARPNPRDTPFSDKKPTAHVSRR
jgi:pseudouridine synthase